MSGHDWTWMAVGFILGVQAAAWSVLIWRHEAWLRTRDIKIPRPSADTEASEG